MILKTPPESSRADPLPAVELTAGRTRGLMVKVPLLGEKSAGFLLQLLCTVFLLTLALTTFIVFMNIRSAGHGIANMTAAGQARTLSQQIAKATYALIARQPGAGAELHDAGRRMGVLIERLSQGGDYEGMTIPPPSPAMGPVLDALRSEWARTDRNLKALGGEEKIPGAAGTVALQVLNDNTSLAAAADKLARAYAGELDRRNNSAIAALLGSVALGALILMAKVFSDDIAARRAGYERHRRAAEAARNAAEVAKDAAQAAVLRLRKEMEGIADGDLRVRTTVSTDITGAIAEAVNYALDELSVLVKRINGAASHVAAAASAAQDTSTELLAASERQLREIEAAGTQVRSMAESINAVSAHAGESASVARQSLDAAAKGTVAVQNSIAGMNDIRHQMQETAKRIKRLGESSQEIGEIVELISDITEQTHVLALNAAIQASSAGEAGRGFSVVAEEVQRLAERSAAATREIAAIVSTIQVDTHDAVTAMENSTQGVVGGTRLSDAAGQALTEISTVSRNLARLIENISADTRRQAVIATEVARAMQEIQRISGWTMTGTQQTAGSIGELAGLAAELKGSVANFKV